MNTRKIEHNLSPEYAAHFRETVEAIQQHERQALAYDGQAAAERREMDIKRRHLGQLITLIAAVEKLPQSVVPYRLSPDATKIIGEAEPNGDAV